METMKPATKTSPATLCICGKRMNKYAGRCKACHKARIAELISAARGVVASGKCPECSLPLRRNITLPGWWQCAAYGSLPFRAPEHKNAAPCLFQTFTE